MFVFALFGSDLLLGSKGFCSLNVEENAYEKSVFILALPFYFLVDLIGWSPLLSCASKLHLLAEIHIIGSKC